jgi:hypothetical protein
MKRAIILPSLIAAFVALSPAAAAFADPSTTQPGNPSGTGQPNQEADDQPSQPAGFETDGFGIADDHYAGEPGTGSTHSKSLCGCAVSQYDVAAYQVSTHGANVGNK